MTVDQATIDQEIESCVETLLRGQEIVSATVARSIIGRLVQRVRTYERDSILMTLMSTEDVAMHYGVRPSRIRAKAQWLRRRGQSIGWQLQGTQGWIFRPEELPMLAPLPEGRPRGRGNAETHEWATERHSRGPTN